MRSNQLALSRVRVAHVDRLNQAMRRHDNIPASLKIVAWLFILFGISSAIEIVVAIFQGRLSFNFGVVGIFVGRGLLRLQPGWRTCALVLTRFELLLLPI